MEEAGKEAVLRAEARSPRSQKIRRGGNKAGSTRARKETFKEAEAVTKQGVK